MLCDVPQPSTMERGQLGTRERGSAADGDYPNEEAQALDSARVPVGLSHSHAAPPHCTGRDYHRAGIVMALDQAAAAVSVTLRYRHQPTRIHVFLSHHDDAADLRGDFTDRMGVSQVILGPSL
jgi:hypothetical protein